MLTRERDGKLRIHCDTCKGSIISNESDVAILWPILARGRWQQRHVVPACAAYFARRGRRHAPQVTRLRCPRCAYAKSLPRRLEALRKDKLAREASGRS